MAWAIKVQSYTDRFVPPNGGPYVPPVFDRTMTNQPDATNTGVEPWKTALTVHPPGGGDLVVTAAGSTVGPYWHITGRVIIQAANVTVSRCLVTGKDTGGSVSGTTAPQYLIDASSLSASGFLVKDTTLQPAFPSKNWNAALVSVGGHFLRCKWLDCVDGMGVFNSHSGHVGDPINLLVEACFGDLSAFYSPDPAHSGDNQTHGDNGGQIQGCGKGSHLEFRYCNFTGMTDPTLRSEDGTDAGVTLSGVRVYGDIGRSASNQNSLHGYSRRYPAQQCNSSFQTSINVTGAGLYGLDIHHCWLDGGQASVINGDPVGTTNSAAQGPDNWLYNNIFGGNTSSGQDLWIDRISEWGDTLQGGGTPVITMASGRTFAPWSLTASWDGTVSPFTSGPLGVSDLQVYNSADPLGGQWATGHVTYDSANNRIALHATTVSGTTTMGAFYWKRAGSSNKYGAWEVDIKTDNIPGYGLVCLLWPETGSWPYDGEIDFYELQAGGYFGTVKSGGTSNWHLTTRAAVAAGGSTGRHLKAPTSSTRSQTYPPATSDLAAGNYQIDLSQLTTLRCEWQPGKYVATFVNGELRGYTTDLTYIPSTLAMNLTVQQEVYTAVVPVVSANTYVYGMRAYTR